MNPIFVLFLMCAGFTSVHSQAKNVCGISKCNDQRNQTVFDCTETLDKSAELTPDVVVPDTIRSILFSNCDKVSITSECLDAHNLNLTEIRLRNVQSFEIRTKFIIKEMDMSFNDRGPTTIIKLGGFINSTCEVKFSEEETDTGVTSSDLCFTGCELKRVKENSFRLQMEKEGRFRFEKGRIDLIETGGFNFTDLKLFQLSASHIGQIQKHGLYILNPSEAELKKNTFEKIARKGIFLHSNSIRIEKNRFASLGGGELLEIQPLQNQPSYMFSFINNTIKNLNGTEFLVNSKFNWDYKKTVIQGNTLPCSCSAADHFQKAITNLNTTDPKAMFLIGLRRVTVCTEDAKRTLEGTSTVNCRDGRQLGLPLKSSGYMGIANILLLLVCVVGLSEF